MNASYQGFMPSFRVALLGALLVFATIFAPRVLAQDAGPQADIPPLVTESPAPALIAQAVVPKAGLPVPTPAPAVPAAKRVHDPLSPPEYRKGDSCTYVRTDWPAIKSEYTETVTFVTPRDVSITAVGRDTTGHPWERQRHLTTDGNVVSELRDSRFVVISYSAPKEYFHWPLIPGASWDTSVTRPYSGSGGRGIARENLRTTVIGVDEVKVPAGTFKVAHVRLTAQLTVDGPGWRAIHALEEDVWFSSETGCVVKRDLIDRNISEGGIARRFLWHLQSYHKTPRLDDQ